MKKIILKNKIKILLLSNLIFGLFAAILWTIFLVDKTQILLILALSCNTIQFTLFGLQLLVQSNFFKKLNKKVNLN